MLEHPVEIVLKECSCSLKALRHDIETNCSLDVVYGYCMD